MRQEDKEVDGSELERAEERKRENELVEEKDDELHDLDGLPETRVDEQRRGTIVGAMRKILEGGVVDLEELELPQRQLNALFAVKEAYEGKDRKLSRFVYAEDRRALLEQALAVLQPEIATTLGDELDHLIADVAQLRDKLNSLEDAEEEQKAMPPVIAKEEGDKDDDEDGEDEDEDEDEDTEGDGEDVVDGEKPTTLGDPGEIEEAAARNAAENLANAQPVARVAEVVTRWKRTPSS